MKKVTAAILSAIMLLCDLSAANASTGDETLEHSYSKGNFAHTYSELTPNRSAWRDGMVSGNGETGYITSGSPYNDTFIFQHMYFNYPSSYPRKTPENLPSQLEDARLNVFNLNANWSSGHGLNFDYGFHPGHQLRLSSRSFSLDDCVKYGTVRFINKKSVNVLAVSGGVTNNGADIIQWSYNHNAEQHWTLETAGDGYYFIKNKNSNKVIGVYNGETNNGAAIVQWDKFTTSTDQQWKPVPVEKDGKTYYKLINRKSGRCMAVTGGSTNEGAKLIQWDDTGGEDQLFSIEVIPSDYERSTNYETAETNVRYSDSLGTWRRSSFTSRTDGVSVTKLTKSSEGSPVNLTVSIDNIGDMYKSWDGNDIMHSNVVSKLRYKKIVPDSCEYIAMAAHYPAFEGSELYDGGFGGVTYIIAEGEAATKTRVNLDSKDNMLLSDNPAVKIENADAVYLITSLDRTYNMTGSDGDVMAAFEKMSSYKIIDELAKKAKTAAQKYTQNGKFDYNAALAPSAELQKEEFNRMRFSLEGDEEDSALDNASLIAKQKQSPNRINHEFMRRSYEEARYAMICCGGTSAPRLYGMWTGEWNPAWRSTYTLDANVNLQVSAMNTGNLREFQKGYLTFFLRHAPDFMENAKMSYNMHDAIQVSVNADADRAMTIEYDGTYPFQYWNAGASWTLLPIYEYWQCFGNEQIPINDYMKIDDLQGVLSVNDGGLTDEEFAALKARGYLDLEKDILLPLLTKQANFWEQIVTPRYYMDADGNAFHDESKTRLSNGEKYIITPGFSPENRPENYNSPITANVTMDIAAARDGLDMVCALEKAVGREGSESAIEKWKKLKNDISDYKFDSDGALCEWAMNEYTENNNHRHLSHLYVAWPAYETKKDPALFDAAKKALENRNKFNTGDATAGHGWLHKALVEARLGDGNGMAQSLLKMMASDAYYTSLLTDHDTNRRNNSFCTDTAFGTVGAINEAIVFSNTGEIELIPALPEDWTQGSVQGIMARTRAEINDLRWDIDANTVSATITSIEDGNKIRLSCGEQWSRAKANGEELKRLFDENGSYVEISLNENEAITVEFTLSSEPISPSITTELGWNEQNQ